MFKLIEAIDVDSQKQKFMIFFVFTIVEYIVTRFDIS